MTGNHSSEADAALVRIIPEQLRSRHDRTRPDVNREGMASTQADAIAEPSAATEGITEPIILHEADGEALATDDGLPLHDFTTSAESLFLGEAIQAEEEVLFMDEQNEERLEDEGSRFTIVEQLAVRGELTPGFETRSDAFILQQDEIKSSEVQGYDDSGDETPDPGPGPGPGPDPGPGPLPEPNDYVERMVMYLDKNVLANPDDYEMTAHAQNHKHNPVCSCTDNSENGYGYAEFFDGQLIYQMSDQTRQYLYENGGYLIDYVSYIDENGVEHRVQVILTVADENGHHDFDTDDSVYDHTVDGETHYSFTDQDKYDVRSSDGSDVLEFGIFKGTLETGRGSDDVLITGTVTDSVITLGADRNEADAGGSGESNRLRVRDSVKDSGIFGTAGNEDISISMTVDSAYTQSGTAVSGSTIDTGDGSDKVVIMAEAFGAYTNVTAVYESGIHIHSNSTLDITASGLSGNVTGVRNSTLTGTDNSGITIFAESGYSGDAEGKGSVVAVQDTDIRLGNDSELDISARSLKQDVTGVAISDSSQQHIIVGDRTNVHLSVSGQGGNICGMHVKGSLDVNGGKDSRLELAGSSGIGALSGIDVDGGSSRISMQGVLIDLEGKGKVRGLDVHNGGFSQINASQFALYIAEAATAEGMTVSGAASNINADQVDIMLGYRQNGSATGLVSSGTIIETANSGNADGSQLITSTGNINARIIATNRANGIQTQLSGNKGSARTTLTANGDITLSVISQNANSYGIDTNGNGYSGQAVTSLHAGGNISVSTAAYRDAIGTNAANGGHNSLQAGGSLSVNTISSNGSAYGVNVRAKSATEVSAGDGRQISITAEGAASAELVAVSNGGSATFSVQGGQFHATASAGSGNAFAINNTGGKASIDTGEASSVQLSAASTSGHAYGLSAVSGGNNLITQGNASTFSVDARSAGGFAYGMAANGNGSSNIVIMGNHATVSMASQSGNSGFTSDVMNAANLLAEHHGLNHIKTGTHASVDMGAEGSGEIANMRAFEGGQNILQTGNNSTVSLTATSDGIRATCLDADASYNGSPNVGQNVINAGTGSTVNLNATAETANSLARGMNADKGGMNSVTANTVNIDVKGYNASGITSTGGHGKNRVDAVDLVLKATAANEAVGMETGYEGELNISISNSLEIVADGQSAVAYGVGEGGKGAVLAAGNASMALSAQSRHDKAAGMEIHGESTVKAGKHASLSVTATAGNGEAVGIEVSHAINNTTGSPISEITLGDHGSIMVKATSGSSGACALKVDAGTSVVSAGDNSSISLFARSATGAAYGMTTAADTTSAISVGDNAAVRISADGASQSAGILASGDWQIEGGSGSTVSIDASTSGGYVYGISNTGATAGTINAGDVAIHVNGSGGWTHGIYTDSGSRVDINSTGDVNISGTGSSYTFGLYCTGNQSTNAGSAVVIHADGKISIDMQSSSIAYALNIRNGSLVQLYSPEAISVKATASGSAAAVAFQLYYEASAELLSNGSGSLFVSAGSNGISAYAFELGWQSQCLVDGFQHIDISASSKLAQNAISITGNSAMSISYNYDLDALMTFRGNIDVNSGSKLEIITGSGDDTILIDGAVSGDYNSSSDTYTCQILTGAGDDSLVITGDVLGMLADLGSGNDMISIDLNKDIHDNCFKGGEGMDTFQFSGNLSINDFLADNVLESFEIFDMSGNGSSDTFTLDAFLASLGNLESLDAGSFESGESLGLSGESVIRVQGDSDDSVLLRGNWANAVDKGYVTYDGITYHVYMNSSNEYVMIQSEVIVAF